MESSQDSKIIRPLGIGEELCYLSEQVFNAGPTFLLEIEGTRTESQWREAIKKLQKLHPLMNVCVEQKESTQRPLLKYIDNPIKPKFTEWNSNMTIEKELESAFSKHFGKECDSMFYFKIYQDTKNNKTILRGSYSHIVYDGSSGLIMIDDLLNFVSNENFTKQTYPILDPPEVILGDSNEWSYSPRSKDINIEITELVSNPKPTHVRCGKFSKDLSDALVKRAKELNVTVHAILTGIFAKVACPSDSTSFSMTHPINQRPQLKLVEFPGMIGLGTTMVVDRVHEDSVSDLAKQMKPKLVEARSLENNKHSFPGLKIAICQNLTPLELTQSFLSYMAPLTLSNYGVQQYVRQEYDDLKVKSIYIGNTALTSIKVDVLNLRGELFIMTTNRKDDDVFKNLIPNVEKMLKKELNMTE